MGAHVLSLVQSVHWYTYCPAGLFWNIAPTTVVLHTWVREIWTEPAWFSHYTAVNSADCWLLAAVKLWCLPFYLCPLVLAGWYVCRHTIFRPSSPTASNSARQIILYLSAHLQVESHVLREKWIRTKEIEQISSLANQSESSNRMSISQIPALWLNLTCLRQIVSLARKLQLSDWYDRDSTMGANPMYLERAHPCRL